uniref:F-box domain-containing protein n=1 Tax=Panagrellus redivivus TaxID=6233 RepID=A0A7E4V5W7_PANRE
MSSESFPLLSLPFPAVQHFLSVLPIKEVLKIRQTCKTLKNWSSFRGEIVETLIMHNDKDDYKSCIPYEVLLSKRFPVTPLNKLNVFMTPSNSPEAILASMDSPVFKEVRFNAHYHWRQIFPFLHDGLERLYLFDEMDLPANDMPAFFKALSSFKGEVIWIHCNTLENHWFDAAFTAWSSLKGSVFESVRRTLYYLIEAVTMDGKLILFNNKLILFNNKFV